MATKRDLVEAHAFNRRRLVAAFLSGAPGGREVEPARPARAVVGGAVLAVLVVGGSALFGFLRPGLPDDWNQNKLVISRESASRYVATDDGVLNPVLNTSSARLVLPPSDYAVVFAPDDEIAGQRIGDTIGIIGAPDTLPAPDELVQTGWTSCIDRRGSTMLRLAEQPGAEAAGDGAAQVVTANEQVWVLWDQARYPVAPQDVNGVLLALRLAGNDPLEVPGTWLDLFPEAAALRPVTVPAAGEPFTAGQAPEGAVVGSVLVVESVDGTTTRYLLTAEGIAELSDVASSLYAISADAQAEVPASQGEIASLAALSDLPYPAVWPAPLPNPWVDVVTCALLTADDDEVPVVSLARLSDDDAAPVGGASAVVQPDHGSLIRAIAGTITNRGTISLVDSTAQRFPLGAPTADVAARLGYADTVPTLVPLSWAEALREGPELSEQAARGVVSAAPEAAG